MKNVLGIELHHAEELLRAEGESVQTLEVRSRKGVNGNEARVVRQCVRDDGTVVLTYAIFKTDYEYQGG